MNGSNTVHKAENIKKKEIRFLRCFSEEEIVLRNKILACLNKNNLIQISKAIGIGVPNVEDAGRLIHRIVLLINRLQIERDTNTIADAVNAEQELCWCLLIVIKTSGNVLKEISHMDVVAARAITILNLARVPFSGLDLSSIRIPNADLSCGILDNTNFSRSDLSGVNFRGSWLRGAKLNKSKLGKAQFGMPFVQLSNSISSCCYSLDGEFLAVASDKNIYIYRSKGIEPCYAFSAHAQEVSNIVFGKNGLLISGSGDGSIRIWNIKEKYLKYTFKLKKEQNISKLFINSEGKIEELPSLKNSDKEDQELRGLDGHLNLKTTCVAVDINCKWIAVGDDSGTIWIWDIERGCLLNTYDAHKDGVREKFVTYARLGWREENSEKKDIDQVSYTSKTQGVTSMAFNINGWLATVGKDGTAQIWMPTSHEINSKIKINFQLVAKIGKKNGEKKIGVAWGSNGLLAFGYKNGPIHVWDINDPMHLVCTFEGHKDGGVTSLVFKNNSTLVSSGRDRAVRVWDIHKKALLNSFDNYDSAVTSVAIHNEGIIASGSIDGRLQMIDIKQKYFQSQDVHLGEVNDISILESKGWIASGSWDNTLRVWDINLKQLIFIARDVGGGVLSVDFCKELNREGYLAAGNENGDVQIWDVKNKSLIRILRENNKSHITKVAFGPHGWLVSGAGDGIVRIWDVSNGNLLYSFENHCSIITGLVFDSTDLLISSSYDGTLQVLDLKHQHLLHTFHASKDEWYKTIDLGQNKLLATAGTDGTVQMWDLEQKSLTYIMNNFSQKGQIYSLAIGPQGWLALGGIEKQGGFIKIMDFESQRLISEVIGLRSTVLKIAWLKNIEGTFLFSGSSDKAVRYWRVVEKKQEYKIILHWASQPAVLYTSNASVEEVEEIEDQNKIFFQDNIMAPKASIINGRTVEPPVPAFNVNQFINGKTLLMMAALNNQLDVALWLIEKRPNIDEQEKASGMTALAFAVECRHLKIIKLLGEHRANPNIANNEGDTAVTLAAKIGHQKSIEHLLDYCNVNINQYLPGGVTILMLVICAGHPNIAISLIERGAEVRLTSIKGHSALYMAIANGFFDVVKCIYIKAPDMFVGDSKILSLFSALKESKINVEKIGMYLSKFIMDLSYQEPNTSETYIIIAVQLRISSLVERLCTPKNVNLKDSKSVSALLYATSFNQKDIVKHMLDLGGDVNILHEPSGDSPLTIAAHAGFFDLVKIFCERRAYLNHQDKNGFTALHAAVQKKHIEIVIYLLNQGADYSLATIKNGTTPFLSAGMFGDINMLKIFSSFGISSTQKSKFGVNLLHVAAECGQKNVIEYVLSLKQLDVNDKTNNGCTAIKIAVKHDHIEIFHCLRLAGAVINIEDNRDDNLVRTAAENGSEKMLNYFVQDLANFPQLKIFINEAFISVLVIFKASGKNLSEIFKKIAKHHISNMEIVFSVLHKASSINDVRYAAAMIKIIRFYNAMNLKEDASKAIDKIESKFDPQLLEDAAQFLDSAEGNDLFDKEIVSKFLHNFLETKNTHLEISENIDCFEQNHTGGMDVTSETESKLEKAWPSGINNYQFTIKDGTLDYLLRLKKIIGQFKNEDIIKINTKKSFAEASLFWLKQLQPAAVKEFTRELKIDVEHFRQKLNSQ